MQLSLLWDFGDESTDVVSTNPRHTYPTFIDSCYEATISIMNLNSCQSYFTDTVCITATTSLKEYSLNKIDLYPNPTSGKLTITLEVSNATSVTIRNSLGQLMLVDNQSSSGNLELDISSYPTGIYFLQLEVGGEMVTKKIVKN